MPTCVYEEQRAKEVFRIKNTFTTTITSTKNKQVLCGPFRRNNFAYSLESGLTAECIVCNNNNQCAFVYHELLLLFVIAYAVLLAIDEERLLTYLLTYWS